MKAKSKIRKAVSVEDEIYKHADSMIKKRGICPKRVVNSITNVLVRLIKRNGLIRMRDDNTEKDEWEKNRLQ